MHRGTKNDIVFLIKPGELISVNFIVLLRIYRPCPGIMPSASSYRGNKDQVPVLEFTLAMTAPLTYS